VLVAIVGIIEDLARAEVARRRGPAARALLPAVLAFVASPGLATRAYLPRAAGSVVVLAGAALIALAGWLARPTSWTIGASVRRLVGQAPAASGSGGCR
jgi:hypothetical protein